MRQTIEDTIGTFLLVVTLTGAVIVGYMLNDLVHNTELAGVSVPGSSKNQSCYNLSLAETSECLNRELSSFWIYNLSNEYLYWNNGNPKDINWSFIKESGGVCWQAAEFYVEKARALGFSAKRDDFYKGKEGHSIALIYDDRFNYCILDQNLAPRC